MTDKNQAAALIKSLEKLAGEIRSQILIKGLLELVSLVAGGVMVLFVLDVMAHFPYPIRLVLFFGGLIYALYRFISGPLHKYNKKISAEEVSLLVENHFPEFRSRVISTLQFNNELPKANISLELIGGMMKQTFSMVKNVTLGRVIDKSWQKKTYMTLAVTVLASVILIAAMPAHFKVYLQRLVMPVNYPTKTQIANIQIPEYLVAGESFSVKVEAKGVLPVLGTVILRTAEDRLDTDLVKLDESGNYECKLNGIIENGWLEIELGDSNSERVQLNVVNRPGISSIELVVQPPSYTGLQTILQKSGNVQMPAGSKVKMIIKPTKELQEIKFLNKTTEEKIPDFNVEADGTWVALFTPENSLTYTLSMLDKVGLVSKDIPDFRLTVKEDKKPFIRVIKPASLTELSAKSAMNLEAKIRDDFNLSQIRILYSISNGEFDGATQVQEFKVRKELKDLKGKQFILNEIWSNKGLGLQEGNLLKIRIEAIDNSPAKNVAVSEDILVPIISDAELRMRLSEEFVEAILPVEDLKLKLNKSNRKTEKLGEKK